MEEKLIYQKIANILKETKAITKSEKEPAKRVSSSGA